MINDKQVYNATDKSGREPVMSNKATQFKPGNNANPHGRPKKGETLTDALRDAIDKDALAQALLKLVEKGDVAAIKYAYDRVEGRPKETIEQTIREMPEIIEVDLSEDNTAAED